MPEGSIINTFLALMAMVAVFGAILFAVKKFALKGKNLNNGISVQIISKTVLQPKTSIFVIKVENKTLLIGVTDHHVNTLAELSDDSQTHFQNIGQKDIQQKILQDKLNEIQSSEPQGDVSFAAYLKNAFKRNAN
jgi:flagellar biosynthetic protein FliO